MSFVIATSSNWPRIRLHNASIRAVLPEPTGPPMPTRSGPCVLVIAEAPSSAPEQPRVLRLVAMTRKIGAERPAADIVERCCERMRERFGDRRLEPSEH